MNVETAAIGGAKAAGAVAVLASSGLEGVPASTAMYVVLTLGGVVWIAAQVKSLMSKGTQIPQPLQASILKELASRDEVNKEVRELWARMGKQEEANNLAIERVHSRVDQLAEATSEIKGEIKGIGANVARLLDQQVRKGGAL